MIKIKKSSWGTRSVDNINYAIEPLLDQVNNNFAAIKARIGLGKDITVEITPYGGEYYYRGSFNLTWEEFNQKYGNYLDKYNLYL